MKKYEPYQEVSFGPYKLTGAAGQLLTRTRPLPLSPKAVAVLWTLVSRAGQVVSKEELFTAVWPETVVSEGVLTNCIGELRRALGDTKSPRRYIETVSRRGYRFIAPLSTTPPVVSRQYSIDSRKTAEARSQESEARSSSSLSQSLALSPQPSMLVGRETELAHLHNLFAKAVTSERQIVFVTGEAGIGKTALVETFLGGLRSWESRRVGTAHQQESRSEAETVGDAHPPPSAPRPLPPAPWIAQGQCIEHYGPGEAYLPVLDALGQLCRQPEGESVLGVLQRVAPTWAVQFPALLEEADYAALQPKVAGTTRERMLREMAEALEALSAERALVMVFEDMHWSDVSTIDLLNMLARRRVSARLIVVATYRPAEVIVSEHPLKQVKQELVTRGYGVEVAVGRLQTEHVRQYVHERWSDATAEADVTALVYRRTEGHPLFMVQMMEYLTQQAATKTLGTTRLDAVERLLPQQLRELLEAQLERLTVEEQAILAVASVVGAEFTVASVAAGGIFTEENVETSCDRLVQRGQFIVERELVTWPDGTVSGRYGFRHALYQEVLYQRLSASRRARLHRHIGERQESGYGERTPEIAVELAMHFEQGRDFSRAIHYRYQAGLRALRRYAYQGALTHLKQGLTLLATQPVTPERDQQELLLQLAVGSALIVVKGQASPEVGDAYTRAHQLCQRAEDSSQLFAVLRGLRRFYSACGELERAEEIARQSLPLALQLQSLVYQSEAHYGLGLTGFFLGKPFEAREHLEQAAALNATQQQSVLSTFSANEVGSVSLSYASMSLWLLGYPEQARQRSQEALAQAQELAYPYPLALSWCFSAMLSQFLRDSHVTRERAEAALRLSTEHGFILWQTFALLLRGTALTELGQVEEGMRQLQQGLSQLRATRVETARPFSLSLLAAGHGGMGQPEAGLSDLQEAQALIEKTKECWWEAELWRLKGELTLQKGARGSGLGAREEKSLASGVQGPESEEGRQKAKRKTQNAKIPHPQSPIPDLASEAEECFLKAFDIARQQQAKSLELRAVMSLVRLRQQQAAPSESRTTNHAPRTALAEAHTMLSEVYHWFTEGFDTKDLQEAKALLEDLGEKAKRGNGEGRKGEDESERGRAD